MDDPCAERSPKPQNDSPKTSRGRRPGGGGRGLDPAAENQMARLPVPVAVAGALMPDAHVGYGLPIGGVLATDNAVIPYAVGVDIACRMKLSCSTGRFGNWIGAGTA